MALSCKQSAHLLVAAMKSRQCWRMSQAWHVCMCWSMGCVEPHDCSSVCLFEGLQSDLRIQAIPCN